MKHYISVTTDSTKYSKLMVKADLCEVLKEACHKAPDRKEDCWLISSGYSDDLPKYTREEFNFQYLDTMSIDCDNKGRDPRIIEKWREQMGEYQWVMWETASSTREHPRFRAIVMLDAKIPWINEPEKLTKKSIHSEFEEWDDDHASWFFTPNKAKLGTFYGNTGKPYPSYNILYRIRLQQTIAQANLKPLESCVKSRRETPDGWRHLPSVKKCLDGLCIGERDNALCAACYAMDKNGYKEHIPEFLDECVVESSFKDKWRKRYSR